jgi:hypothetical protein
MPQERSKKAADAMQRAAWHQASALTEERLGKPSAKLHAAKAREHEEELATILAVAHPPAVGAGGEVIEGHSYLRQTLTEPTALNLEASCQRVKLVNEAGIFEAAVDAAESIGARTSMEQMLAHQMALCHDTAFDLMRKAKTLPGCETVEQARLVNAAVRLMTTFQDGLTTLQRIRTGGRQVVTVQHVQVKDGGQAVIAGTVSQGATAGGKKREDG